MYSSKLETTVFSVIAKLILPFKKIPEAFDHSQTDYTLEGKHNEVDCRACHKEKFMTAPMSFDACNRCHNDFHEGQFNHIEK